MNPNLPEHRDPQLWKHDYDTKVTPQSKLASSLDWEYSLGEKDIYMLEPPIHPQTPL